MPKGVDKIDSFLKEVWEGATVVLEDAIEEVEVDGDQTIGFVGEANCMDHALEIVDQMQPHLLFDIVAARTDVVQKAAVAKGGHLGLSQGVVEGK